MDPDQESLLARSSSDKSPYLSERYSKPSGIRNKRNLLLIIILISIVICLTIYLYLNLEAFNGTSLDQTDPNRFKPLSRRKPMLDHESIFSDSGPSMLKLSDLLAHCIVALQIAGQKVVNLSLAHNVQLDQVGSKGKTLEGADDIVTGADMESHHTILRTIKDSYRRLKVVSEEDNTDIFINTSAEDDILPVDRQEFAKMLRSNLHIIEGQHADRGSLVAQHETLVWIDPLDATKEYSENLTDYVTLMACIVHKSTPIAGVIYKPFSRKLYWSMRDSSTNKYHYSPELQKLINLREKKSKTNGTQLNVIVSRSHAGDIKSVLEGAYGDSVNIVSAGGSGYKTIEVIRGRVDVYMHLTRIKKWDVCAPNAIVRSIPGGRMTDLEGQSLKFGDPKDKVIDRGIVASLDKETHQRLIQLVASPKTTIS